MPIIPRKEVKTKYQTIIRLYSENHFSNLFYAVKSIKSREVGKIVFAKLKNCKIISFNL